MYLKVFPKQKKADYRILEAPEDLTLGELHQEICKAFGLDPRVMYFFFVAPMGLSSRQRPKHTEEYGGSNIPLVRKCVGYALVCMLWGFLQLLTFFYRRRFSADFAIRDDRLSAKKTTLASLGLSNPHVFSYRHGHGGSLGKDFTIIRADALAGGRTGFPDSATGVQADRDEPQGL